MSKAEVAALRAQTEAALAKLVAEHGANGQQGGSGSFNMGAYGGNAPAASGGMNPIFLVVGVLAAVVIGMMIFKK